jgi:hypothetical protein
MALAYLAQFMHVIIILSSELGGDTLISRKKDLKQRKMCIKASPLLHTPFTGIKEQYYYVLPARGNTRYC